jgi:leucyl-tRNA synthetase
VTSFDHRDIDARWQAAWAHDRTFATPTDRSRPKYFIAGSCAVPGLRPPAISHVRGPIAADVVARAKRMMGVNVAVAHGWDAYWLPAERLAEREHTSPEVVAERAVETSRRHLARLGLSTDPAREVVTSDPTFTTWTQRLFQTLQRRGLAYRADEAPRPWMLRATAYADRLLDDLDALDWPAGSLARQRWWIGRNSDEARSLNTRPARATGSATFASSASAGGACRSRPTRRTANARRSSCPRGLAAAGTICVRCHRAATTSRGIQTTSATG